MQQAQTEPLCRKGLGPIQMGRRNGEGFAQKVADTLSIWNWKIVHGEPSSTDQAQSPTMTSGARSCLSSEADTGAPFSRLLLCLRLASLELEGGERRMDVAPAVTTWGVSCSCCSSRSSCSASCRFMATALPAKNVRSLVLLFLWAWKERTRLAWWGSYKLHVLAEKLAQTQLTFAAGWRKGDSQRHPGERKTTVKKKIMKIQSKVTKITLRSFIETFGSLPLVPRGAGEPEQRWDVSWRPAQAVWKWGLWHWRKYEPTLSLETHTCPPGCIQTRCSRGKNQRNKRWVLFIEQHMNMTLLT